ncbi:outer membrane protein assembly factor BamE [Thalassobius sp. Cn5-15]|nr:outer membrane protein assembly factor BamE [Thalassobius sp. Cn5-15]MCG7492710.1 outer membrane protein assembly factor BamE [Thalassobius sp. Cn5-15]
MVVVAALSVAGCSASYRNHGFVPPADELAGILVGVDTRDSVSENVGPPTTGGVINNSAYYYVQSRVRHFAYREPEVVGREVVAISFDGQGVVSNIERFGLEDGQVVPLSRRSTDGGIVDQGFIRQLLGNIGQVSAGDIL